MTQAAMANPTKTPGFAYFSDTIRNALKGGTFGGISAGYISGGGIGELNNCFKGMPSWCTTPAQSINYISAHDNNTLFDHISLVKPNASYEEKCAMTKLGVAFYMAAQGIPFMQAGEEMNRTKPSDPTLDANNGNAGEGFFHNSYNAPDRVNSIKWDSLYDQPTLEVLEYYKGMIAFRKAHPALRLMDSNAVSANVFALPNLESNVLGYRINGGEKVNGETAEGIFAAFNASKSAQTVKLPAGTWNICVNGEDAGVASLGTAEGTVQIPAVSSVILVKGDVPAPTTEPSTTEPAGNNGGMDMNMIIIIAAVAVVAVAVVVALVLKKKK
jgi:pullulanase